MSKIMNFQKFLETKLNLDALAQIRNGRVRGNTLVDKLKGDKKLVSDNTGKEVVISKMKDDSEFVEPEQAIPNFTDMDGNYDIDRAKNYFKRGNLYDKVFKDKDGVVWQLNQFRKDQDFGSRGAGRNTKIVESIQSLYFGIKQQNPNFPISKQNILRLYRNFRKLYPGDDSNWHKTSPVKLGDVEINDEIIEQFCEDADWLYTFYKVPNKVWLPSLNLIDRGIKYLIYHVSNKDNNSPYVAIYQKYNQLSKSGNFSDIHFNKWCPADVYLIDSENQNEIVSKIKETTSINELNVVIDYYFDKKQMLAISLKKVSCLTKPKIITNREISKELPNFSIERFLITDNPMRGIGSKISTSSYWKFRSGGNVDKKDRLLNLDSSDTKKRQNIDAEVEGSASQHGKINLKAIVRIINSSGLDNLPQIQSHESLRSLNIDELEDLVKKLWEVASKSEMTLLGRTTSRSTDISGNENRLISKIQSLQVVLTFMKMMQIDTQIANDIMTKILRYALSIQTDKFETPRYLRVI